MENPQVSFSEHSTLQMAFVNDERISTINQRKQNNDSGWVTARVGELMSEIEEREEKRKDWLRRNQVDLLSPILSTGPSYQVFDQKLEASKGLRLVASQPMFGRILGGTNSNSIFSFLFLGDKYERYQKQLSTIKERIIIERKSLQLLLSITLTESRETFDRMRRTGQRKIWPYYQHVFQLRNCVVKLQIQLLDICTDLLHAHDLSTTQLKEILDADSLILDPVRILETNELVLKQEKKIEVIENEIKRSSSILINCVPRSLDWNTRAKYFRTIVERLNEVMRIVRNLISGSVEFDSIPESYDMIQNEDFLDNLLDDVFQPTFEEDSSFENIKKETEIVHPTPSRKRPAIECSDADCRISFYRYRTDFSELQDQFSILISDECFREGRIIQKWLQLFSSCEIQKIPPVAVTEFISRCAKSIIVDHRLHISAFEGVHGLLEGHIYPQIILKYYTEQCDLFCKHDEIFRKKISWLKRCPPSAFEAEEQFFKSDEGSHSYDAAISKMKDIEFILIPADMLLCIYETVMVIYEQASQYSRVGTNNIGADNLFPILVYVVIHSELVSPHANLEVIKMFSTKETLNSELGYYLCVWEAAITYITNVTPESFSSFFTEEEVEEFTVKGLPESLQNYHHAINNSNSNNNNNNSFINGDYSNSSNRARKSAELWVDQIESVEDLVESLAL